MTHLATLEFLLHDGELHFLNSQGLDDCLGFAQQSVSVLMQCLDLLFAFLSLVAELKQLEYDHSQAYVFAQLSLPPLPTVKSTIPRVTLAADIFWHVRKRLLLARLIRDTRMLLNESMKPWCVRFQGY
jgi:hypothetical protein